MADLLQTASAVISFSKKLEGKSAGVYQELSKKYDQDKETLLAFARENEKYAAQVQRTYYGTISDALEGTFAFAIKPEAYEFEILTDEDAGHEDALHKAIEIETKVASFYSEAARQSKSLLADIPRIFTLITKKRTDRIEKLKALL